MHLVNIQLKNINTLLNNINEDIKKNNEKLEKLLDDFQNKNVIKGTLESKLNINNSIGKLKNEIQAISDFPFINVGINIELPKDENIFEWKGYLIGPDDTSYKGGIFHFKILFPCNFPENAPRLFFLTPIYHFNVNPKDGLLSVSFLHFWNGKMQIRELLIKLKTLFYLHNPDSAFDSYSAYEFKNNRCLFEEKIKYFTRKYAKFNSSQNYDKWDFSYNEKDEKDNNYVNITFEFNGINRMNFLAFRKEVTKNVVIRYCQSIGINNKNMMYFNKWRRLVLDKTIEENEIENNSLIIAIDSEGIIYT